jgi:putative oxidoreductase
MRAAIAIYKRLTAPVGWPLYAIPLRLIVGFGFMEHGYAKLAVGPESFTAILHALGTPAPALFAWITILVELLGGLAVLLGALIPLASLPMAVVLAVATFTVHLPNGFSSIKLLSVDAAGAHSGSRAMRRTCSISRVLWRWCSADRGPGLWMVCCLAKLPIRPDWALARLDRRKRRAGADDVAKQTA